MINAQPDCPGALRQLLADLHFPEADRDALVALMNPLLDGGGRARDRKAAEAFLAEHPFAWPDYDRRLDELGAVRDDVADTIDDDDVIDTMRFAGDIGLSLVDALLSRAHALAMSAHRYQQLRESASGRPYWQFNINDSAIDVPVECVERSGTFTRWDANLLPQLPCWRPDCRCYISSHTQQEFERLTRTN